MSDVQREDVTRGACGKCGGSGRWLVQDADGPFGRASVEPCPNGCPETPFRFNVRRAGPQEMAADACASIAAFVLLGSLLGDIDPDDLATLKAAQAILGRAMDA